jgi:hypothetical protein
MALKLAQKPAERAQKHHDAKLSTQTQPNYLAFLLELPPLAQRQLRIQQRKTQNR